MSSIRDEIEYQHQENLRILEKTKVHEQEQEEATIRQLKNIFPEDILKSFDTLEITKYKLEAILVVKDIPISIIIEMKQVLYTSAYYSLGSIKDRAFEITIPAKNEQPDMLYYQQTNNKNKLVRFLGSLIDTLDEKQQSVIQWWTKEIPRDYKGAFKVPSLLKKLELDKVFLTQDFYELTKDILRSVATQGEVYDSQVAETKAKFSKIVAEEYQRWTNEQAEFEAELSKIATLLGHYYFHSWYVDNILYMAESIDISELQNADGEMIDDIKEAITFSCNSISEPDEEGFRLIVDLYGAICRRKISGNVIHTDRFEFNSYPPVGSSKYWKTIYVDKQFGKYPFHVPPGTEVEAFEIPIRPVSWEDGSKKRGVINPWEYKL